MAQYRDEVNAKMAAEKGYTDSGNLAGAGAPAQTMGVCGEYRASPREQADKQAAYHFDQANKSARAADFFRTHPEFSEFIQLVRDGVIGF